MKKKLDLKDKKQEELVDMLAEKREAMRTARFEAVGNRLKDSAAPRKLRADVARILTELGTRSA